MKWINFKTTKGNYLAVKEDDIALILIDSSTGEGNLRLNNSCFTYDIIDNGVIKFLCGMSVASPLPDWDPEILRSEIQDLKLENDRLEKQNEIMLKFVRSAYCREMSCDDCMLYDHTKTTLYKCAYNGSDFFYDISAIAGKVLQEIDNL